MSETQSFIGMNRNGHGRRTLASGLTNSQSRKRVNVRRRRNIHHGPNEWCKSVPPKPPAYEDDGRAVHMPHTGQRRAGSRGTCTPRRVQPLDSTWLLIFLPMFLFVVADEYGEVSQKWIVGWLVETTEGSCCM